MKRTTIFLASLALVSIAGCGGTNPGHSISDLRGDAIRPVDKAPPEGTLSEPAQASQPFTLRRPAGSPARPDTVVRVDPPPRTATKPDPAATSPRAVTMTPPVSSTTPAQGPAAQASRPAGASDTPVPSEQFLAQEPPQVISRVPAVSPPRARAARVGGAVLVKVLVGTDGLVHATRIVRSIPELDSAAVACVKQWKFKPAMSSGVAVASWTDVPIRFLIQ